MRVVFMGTPHAAVGSLRAVAASFDVVAVYTRADKPRGRGRQLSPSPLKQAAADLDVPIVQPKTLRGGTEADRLRRLDPDAVVVVAYGMILPPDVLAAPRLGCVNLHFSLLPRWRGAAPVERAILADDAETGVTTMLMDEGLDTGPILMQEAMAIADDDSTGTLTERLAARGAGLLVQTLDGLDAASITPVPQPAHGVTTAPKVEPAEAELDFTKAGADLARAVRAFDPSPGAYTSIAATRVKVWRARVVDGDGPAGAVAATGADGIDVQTARGRLRLEVVQPEGKRRMTGAEFVRGRTVSVGESVGR